MPNKKLYRVRKEQINIVPKVMNSRCAELSFKQGYVFIKAPKSEDVFMISSTPKKRFLKVELVSVEIVEE